MTTESFQLAAEWTRKQGILAALHDELRPVAPVLAGGHRQTAFAPAFRRRARLPFALERWHTPDDDFIRVHIAEGEPDQPIVVLLHGLEGDVGSPYIQGLARRLVTLRYTVVVMEQRSCGGEMNRARRLYHLGSVDDVGLVLARVRSRWPQGEICAVGYSAGGNQLALWLAEQGERASSILTAAVVVSAPFDLMRTGPHLDLAFGGWYARWFLRTLIPKARQKAEQFPGCLDVERVVRARTFAEFDDAATAPLHGFLSVEHYWRTVSCGPVLCQIRTPTLLLSAVDDPFHPPDTLPRDISDRSPWLYGVFPEVGGHVGFVNLHRGRPQYFGETLVVRFLSLVLDSAR